MTNFARSIRQQQKRLDNKARCLDTLKAVIYDIDQYGATDPIFMQNLKNEYDNVIGAKLIKQAIQSLGMEVEYKTVMNIFMNSGIRVR